MRQPTVIVQTRVTCEFCRTLDQEAQECGQDRSGYIRQALQEKIHRTRETEAVIHTLWRLERELQELRQLIERIVPRDNNTASV